ncbi:hypothetical protein GCM10022222_06140 [Amycolatopsis ultiminotia]|uniref:Pentapeptide repeat-containing protein n=1 Tax=Amycolatopsis ultiminotia TaxID=543629 RepID=A0ABP6V0S7_9PSEU
MTSDKWGALATGVLMAVVLGAVVWFVGVPVSEWAVGPPGEGLTRVEWLTAVNNARSTLLTGLTVVGGIVGAGFGARRYFLDRDKQRLEEDKHLIDRFDAAWGRLASEDPLIRANALRTLFRLMTDSERDRRPVLRSVCDLLRQRTSHPDDGQRAEADVIAAVDVLRERPRREDADPLDLTGVHLPGADLREAVLRGAHFGAESILASAKLSGSDLRDAVLTATDLTGADLDAARLAGATLDTAKLTSAVMTNISAAGASFFDATLRDADLSGADLRGANLRRAVLRGAKLDRADLTDADLTDADFTGADLGTALGLTRQALANAVTTAATTLPKA